MNKIQISRKDLSYEIDYELFTTEEIIKIINFYNHIVKYENSTYPTTDLKKEYREYQNIINNKSLEKKYDSMFQKATGVSIFLLMRDLGC